jgi:glycosyltransferase involved in cell wall biosynthesis
MKTIAITANITWSLYNFRMNLIKKLIEKGYRVIIVAPKDKYTKEFELLGCEIMDIKINSSGLNPVQDILVFLSFIKIYYKLKPDFILNFSPKNNIYSTLAANFFKAKVINNIAGLGVLFIEQSFVSKVARSLYRISQLRADTIFFQNTDDKSLFLKNAICKEAQTKMLPGSGVDLERFQYTPIVNKESIKFIIVARMLWDKGIGEYVEAARVLREKYKNKVQFQMLGFLDFDNPSAVSESEMTKWSEEGIIEYLGVSDQVEKEMCKSDCVVLPSYYREGVPRSLLEASALGRIIITTDSVGCKETVEDGVNGYLCQPRSVESLVSKLELIINMLPRDRELMGMKSRERAEKLFDEQFVIDKYLKEIQCQS